MVRAVLRLRRPHQLPAAMLGAGKDVSASLLHGCSSHRCAVLGVTLGSCCGTSVSHCTFLCHLLAQHPSEPALGRAIGEGNGTPHVGLLPDASWTLALCRSSPSLPASLSIYKKTQPIKNNKNIYFSQALPASLPLPACTSPCAGARGLLP